MREKVFWFIFTRDAEDRFLPPSLSRYSNQNIKFQKSFITIEVEMKKMENSSIRKLKILYSHYSFYLATLKRNAKGNWKVCTQHTVHRANVGKMARLFGISLRFFYFHLPPFSRSDICNKSKSCDKRKLQPDPKRKIAKFKVWISWNVSFVRSWCIKYMFRPFSPFHFCPAESLFHMTCLQCRFRFKSI